MEFKYIYNKKKPLNECIITHKCEIVGIGGCEKLTNPLYLDRLRDNTAEGGRNIIIFDADFGPEAVGEKKGTGNNGFVNAKRKLEDIQKTKEVEFDFYLWHNNANDGEVEDLLAKLIPENKKKLMDCINNHKECLSSLEIDNLMVPDKKKVLGYYLYSLQHDLHDYQNNDVWHLSITDISDLGKFATFLQKYFASNNVNDGLAEIATNA
ncbi:hypothetical protein OQZ29_05680 [Pedobacter agri]|uniref:Uncharacterized protein n=1 Tax=Pedobacter agri TaxID=454586 RepID=A0A9X3DBP0_9SPHI|nr:DUF3226 domain-containing protein [Pedobacter agri]MCX3264226.1 hypothetical protein [Pedobacter agri]